MAGNDKKSDAYLQSAKKRIKPATLKKHPATKRLSPITQFTIWTAMAAMDVLRYGTIIMCFTVITGLTLMSDVQGGLYLAALLMLLSSVGFFILLVDFFKFKNWQTKLHFELHGWDNLLNSRSRSYWKGNGENWINSHLQISLAEDANEKHHQVVDAFLKKLRKRLNQWTISSEKHFGYTDPTGWSFHDEHIIAGDANPRVLNLIRKTFG